MIQTISAFVCAIIFYELIKRGFFSIYWLLKIKFARIKPPEVTPMELPGFEAIKHTATPYVWQFRVVKDNGRDMEGDVYTLYPDGDYHSENKQHRPVDIRPFSDLITNRECYRPIAVVSTGILIENLQIID